MKPRISLRFVLKDEAQKLASSSTGKNGYCYPSLVCNDFLGLHFQFRRGGGVNLITEGPGPACALLYLLLSDTQGSRIAAISRRIHLPLGILGKGNKLEGWEGEHHWGGFLKGPFSHSLVNLIGYPWAPPTFLGFCLG